MILMAMTGCRHAPPPSPAVSGISVDAIPSVSSPTAPIPSPTSPTDNVALAVEGVAVSLDDVQSGWLEYAAAKKIAPEDMERERRVYVQTLLNNLILSQAARAAGADKEADFQKRLRPVYRALLAEFFKDKYILPEVTVSSAEVEAYYQANQSEFEAPPTISVRFILTPTRDQAMAALESIQQGQSFDEVARVNSSHPSALNGGVLPPFSKGSYDADFERIAWSLNVGEMSGVVFTDLGYCIIEKTGQTDAITAPLDSVREEIRTQLLQKKREQRLAEYLNTKRQTFNIFINHHIYESMPDVFDTTEVE